MLVANISSMDRGAKMWRETEHTMPGVIDVQTRSKLIFKMGVSAQHEIVAV